MRGRTSSRGSVRRALVVSAVMVGLTALPAQAAPRSVAEDVDIPVTVSMTVTGVECTNAGSSIDLKGTLSMGGLLLQTVFKNNVKGTKTVVVGESSMDVVEADVEDLPKQPVLGGVGGNPWISVALATLDEAGAIVLISTPVVVGRCVQGVTSDAVTLTADLPANAFATATGLDCSSKGSHVSLDASAALSPLFAAVVFDNNLKKVVHRSIQATDSIVTLAGGDTHKGWGQADGAGGNPLVYLRFVTDSGGTADYLVGRCKDLL